jgi:hypothetical protein
MARKIVQDIIFNKKAPKAKSAEPKMPEKPLTKDESFEKLFSKKEKKIEEYPAKHISKNSRVFLWVITIACVATLLLFMSSYFATATVTIAPKSEIVTLNDTYPISTSTTALGLHYEVMTINKSLSKSLETDGESNVEKKAIGKAKIFNNFSSASQRLINNTRLETKGGLIYRIRQSVDVPGMRTINGVKTPGSVEVEIIADVPGVEYNMKISDLKGDFTIPGLKGTERYNYFFARLSADLVGGFVGKAKTVSDAKIETEREGLKKSLTDELIKDLYTQNPDQYVIFKGGYFVTFDDLPDISDDSGYKISEDATIHAIAFRKNELAEFIAKNKVIDFDGSAVDILWTDEASISVTGKTARPWMESSLKVTFSGNTKVVWSYDAKDIVNMMLGKDKSVVKSIMEKYKSSIVKMETKTRPSWKSSFPDNAKKIKVFDSVRNASVSI